MAHLMTVSALCYALGYGTGATAFVGMARRRRLATAGIMALLGQAAVGDAVLGRDFRLAGLGALGAARMRPRPCRRCCRSDANFVTDVTLA